MLRCIGILQAGFGTACFFKKNRKNEEELCESERSGKILIAKVSSAVTE